MVTKVNCPNCKKEVIWNIESPFKPFCSEKCKLIDMGQWADEQHRIPERPIGEQSIDIEDIEEQLSQLTDTFFKHN